jgi:hypothetical protein
MHFSAVALDRDTVRCVDERQDRLEPRHRLRREDNVARRQGLEIWILEWPPGRPYPIAAEQ